MVDAALNNNNSKKKAEVSVIIPVFNAEETLKDCLLSVLSQSITDIEVIVVDDGSSDSSSTIVKEIAKSDQRIKYLYQNNQGVSVARNNGIYHSAGGYLTFIDSDDLVKPDYIKHLIEAVEYTDADVIIGGCVFMNTKDSTEKVVYPSTVGDCTKSVWECLAYNESIYGYAWGKLIKKDVLENVSFNPRLYSQEDLEFYIRVYNLSAKVCAIQSADYIYNYQKSNRKPDFYTYINNKVEIYSNCAKLGILNKRITDSIHLFLSGYLFSIFNNSDDIQQDFHRLALISGLKPALTGINVNNKRSFIAWMYLHNHAKPIKYYFKLRKLVKKTGFRRK